MSTIITREDGSSLQFDRTDIIRLPASATVPDRPLEDGSSVSDNSYQGSKDFSLTVYITETPYQVRAGESTGEARINDARSFLDEVGAEGEIITVSVPRVGVFSSYVVQSWSTTINRDRSASFDLEFKQIRIAEVTTAQVAPVEAIAPASRAGQQPAEDVGEQPSEDVEERKQPTPPASLLTRIFG